MMIDDEDLCVCCIDTPRNTRFKLCGHSTYCVKCRLLLTKQEDFSCPLCRVINPEHIIIKIPSKVYIKPKKSKLFIPKIIKKNAKRIYLIILEIILYPFFIIGTIIYYTFALLWPWRYFDRSPEKLEFIKKFRGLHVFICIVIQISPVLSTCTRCCNKNICHVGIIISCIICAYQFLLNNIVASFMFACCH